MHKDTAGGIGAKTRKRAFYHEVRLLSLKMGLVYHGGKCSVKGFMTQPGKLLYTDGAGL